MADTYTSALKLRKPEVGANNNTWGTLLNEDALDLLDHAIAGWEEIELSSSDVTLTSTEGESNEARASFLFFTGTLTANVAVILPTNTNNRRVYTVRNSTTGAFTVTVKVGAASATVDIPQDGASYLIHKYGNDVVQAVRMIGGALLDEVQTWGAAQGSEWITLTDAANIAIDARLGNNFVVTLGGNRTLSNPTNLEILAQQINVLVIQDGTGGRTLSYGSAYRWPSGAPPTLTTTATDANLLTFQRYVAGGGTRWLGSMVGPYDFA